MSLLLVHNAVPPEAPPDEADVLVQADAVAAAAAAAGHTVARYACGLDLADLAEAVRRDRPTAAFNLVESLGGSGRLIAVVPALLEALGVPVAGCPSEALHLTSHKILAKQLLAGADLPTPAWLTDEGGTGGGPETGRWIVKSVWEDASLGLDDDAIVAGAAGDLAPRLAARRGTAGAPWFAEAYVEGREFNIAVLDGPDGPELLPLAEMLFADYPPDKPRIVGYAAKWHEGSFEYTHTLRTFAAGPGDGPLRAELARLTLACWRLFGLRGWARVDFRVDAAGRPWILEINANPCLSPDAGFAAALDAAGIDFAAAVARIVATAG